MTLAETMMQDFGTAKTLEMGWQPGFDIERAPPPPPPNPGFVAELLTCRDGARQPSRTGPVVRPDPAAEPHGAHDWHFWRYFEIFIYLNFLTRNGPKTVMSKHAKIISHNLG